MPPDSSSLQATGPKKRDNIDGVAALDHIGPRHVGGPDVQPLDQLVEAAGPPSEDTSHCRVFGDIGGRHRRQHCFGPMVTPGISMAQCPMKTLLWISILPAESSFMTKARLSMLIESSRPKKVQPDRRSLFPIRTYRGSVISTLF